MTRYRGPAPADLVTRPLETLLALYHRPSGQTHLLAQPLPEILATLTGATASLDELLDRLGVEPNTDTTAALAARLAELDALGLVECVE